MMKLRVELDFSSDFHVGTGAGLGRVVDAVIARTAAGEPVVPGSTIKGLARDAVAGLPAQLRDADVVARVFGLPGKLEGAVRFSDALPETAWIPPAVHGRSARDRERGRALDDALFRVEDATACRMVAHVESARALDEAELMLLITALRRIEAIGGQRRRGKGQVSVTLKVLDGPGGWNGTQVPGNSSVFEAALRRALDSPSATDPVDVATEQAAALPATEWEDKPGGGVGVLWVLARADAPLVLSAAPEVGNATRTLAHVPGTSLRGAIATHLVHRGLQPDSPLFQSIFVRERVHFGPLYPCQAWNRERSFPLPAPASLLTCKYHAGLRGDDPQAHGVVDVLPETSPERCSADTKPAPLIPLGSIIQAERDDTGERTLLRSVKPAICFATHVSIDPETQRAEEHMLYGQEQVPLGTWFAGFLWGSAHLLDAIRDAVDGTSVTVGKARTRGHGDLVLHLPGPGESCHPVFPGLLPPSNTQGLEADGFTLTLYSDLIAVDSLLRPVTRLDGAALWFLLDGSGAAPFEVVRGYSATRTVLGFNGVPGRPRTADVAVVAGSTWRFRWTDPTRRVAVHSLLSRAQEHGLGLRCGEGFGRVLVDLPLHACRLDQTRGHDPDPGLELVLPSIPAGRSPIQPLKPPPAPRIPGGLQVEEVPEADRSGLARLLWRAAQVGSPESSLRRAIKARNARRKARSGTDELLQALVERANQVSFRDELRACAIALEGKTGTARLSTAARGSQHA